MNRYWLATSLILVALATPPCRAQTRAEEVQRLREQIDSLQEKLHQMETAPTSVSRERSTQLGRSRSREEEPEILVRIYDLSDLLAMVVPYPAMLSTDLEATEVPLFPSPTGTVSGPNGMSGAGAMGGMSGMGGMGGGMFTLQRGGNSGSDAAPSKTSPRLPKDIAFQVVGGSSSTAQPKRAKGAASGMQSARIDLDTLIDAITSTIDAPTWEDVGGPASIRPLGNALIVSAAPRTHDQITALLDSFRKRWGTLRTISVEAHWLWLSEPQLGDLLVPLDKMKPGEPRAFGLVDEAAWDAHAKETRNADAAQPAGYRAVITCYNGQTVHTVSGQQRNLIVGMTPLVGESPSVGYQPVVATLQEGAALQITPMTTVGGKFVVLDLHSRVVRSRRPTASKARTKCPSSAATREWRAPRGPVASKMPRNRPAPRASSRRWSRPSPGRWWKTATSKPRCACRWIAACWSGA